MSKLGNPALLPIIASNPQVREKAAETTVRVKKTIGFVGKGLLVVGGIFLTRLAIRNMQKQAIQKKISSNHNYRAAVKIYNLLPANLKSKSLFDPETIIDNLISTVFPFLPKTETQQILNVAKEITEFNETQKAFNILYRSNLVEVLQKVLSPSDFNLFFNYANQHKPGSVEVKPANLEKKGFRVVTTTETTVYSITKSSTNKLSTVVQLKQSIPAGVSLGIFEGAKVNGLSTGDTREFYVCKFGQNQGHTAYLLVSSRSCRLIKYSANNSFKKIQYIPATGHVIKIQ